jgi:hypothetical protein
MVVSSHARGPDGGVASPSRFASAEELLGLWDESAAEVIEERLAAIQEMIRSWDWRANTFDEHGVLLPRPGSPVRQSPSGASPLQQPPATICSDYDGPPFSPRNGHAAGHASGSTVRPVDLEDPASTPPRRRVPQLHSRQFSAPPTGSQSQEPPPSPTSLQQEPLPLPPSDVLLAIFEPPTITAEPVGAEVPLSPFAPATAPPVDPTASPLLDAVADDLPVRPIDEAKTTPEPGLRGRGTLVLWLVAIVAVVLFIAIVRHHNPGQTPGPPTPASVQPTPAAHAAVIPVPAPFIAATKNFDAANAFVQHALADGSSLPQAQVQQIVSFYIGELEKYDFTLHISAWPQSLQGPSDDLMLGNQALVSFLQSFSSETQGEMPSWFSQLHGLSSQAETADNFFRKDIGLAPSTYYP